MKSINKKVKKNSAQNLRKENFLKSLKKLMTYDTTALEEFSFEHKLASKNSKLPILPIYQNTDLNCIWTTFFIMHA